MASSSTSFRPDSDAHFFRARHGAPGAFPADEPSQEHDWTFVDRDEATANTSQQGAPPPNPNPRVYGPRTCRICLEVNHPTMKPSTLPSIPGLPDRLPHVVYESTEPELGRLISPCKCKGSSRYVHEGCLRQWRMAAPSSDRNYWKCPTCGYQYRLERLQYAKLIQSLPSQIVLTIIVFVAAMFIMGFIADPIINAYLDPWGYLGWFGGYDMFEYGEALRPSDEEPLTWSEHFFKGMAGLGVLGAFKMLFTSPLTYWRSIRIGGGSNTGRRSTGRDRANDLGWFVIIIGVATTLYVSGNTRSLTRPSSDQN